MAQNANGISLKKSKRFTELNGVKYPNLPSADKLVEGELAINYAEGLETISTKNESGNVVTFSSDDYYSEKKLGSGFTGINSAITVTDVIIENEEITSAALTDLDNRKLDATAYTPTDLSNYYKKSETSGATEISNALGTKVNSATFNSHTGSTTLHFSGSEKTNLDSLATNIGAISGITSAKVTSWDNAVNDLSALTADVSGQSETVAAALNVLNDSIDNVNDSIDVLNDSIDNVNDSIDVLNDSIDNVNDKFEGVDVVIEQKTKVTAIALNDLDDRINGLSDNLGGLKFKCLTQQEYNTLIINDEIDDFTLYITIDAVHEYVDLGLPSGTKWAKMNVGANSETDYGNYYQYGKGADTYQVTSGQSNYSGMENPLALSADTVAQVWGGQWHTPTKTQFEELTANTTYEWTTINGVEGGKFTATNGNYVFFPSAGHWDNGSLVDVGNGGYYWSSAPYDSGSAYFLGVADGEEVVHRISREYGYSVRGVLG